jgi:hypothetical protein
MAPVADGAEPSTKGSVTETVGQTDCRPSCTGRILRRCCPSTRLLRLVQCE